MLSSVCSEFVFKRVCALFSGLLVSVMFSYTQPAHQSSGEQDWQFWGKWSGFKSGSRKWSCWMCVALSACGVIFERNFLKGEELF